jgi:glutathione S-transferase
MTIRKVAAENFDPEYLKINHFGTVPSLVVPSLSKSLVDRGDILKYLDEIKTPSLTPSNPKLKAIVEDIVALVHSDDVGMNLILLQARDKDEYEDKRRRCWNVHCSTAKSSRRPLLSTSRPSILLDRRLKRTARCMAYMPRSLLSNMMHSSRRLEICSVCFRNE